MLMTMSGSLWRALDKVNRAVNAMPYQTDMELYGRVEYWNPDAESAGDCDDYALVKRKQLHALYPEHTTCFRLATCWVEGDSGMAGAGDYHAVLTVWTDRGVYVLDNRYPEVMPYPDLPYLFHKVEQPGQKDWAIIEQ